MEVINTNRRDIEGSDWVRKKATAREAKSTALLGISSQNTKIGKNRFNLLGTRHIY